MEITNRSIGDVIGHSKVLLDSIPISSCVFSVDSNTLYIEHNMCIVSLFNITHIKSTEQVNLFVIEFYNRLIELSKSANRVYNLSTEAFRELVIDKINTRT